MADTLVARRKSCGECAKAKRRCDMQMPRCQRCTKKNIDCRYPRSGPPISEVPIPELDFPWLDDLLRAPETAAWADVLAEPALSNYHPTNSDGTSLPDFLQIEPPSMTTLARQEMTFAVRQFKTYPEKWLKEGKAPFIHRCLYATNMPRALQDAYAACAIYSTKTEENSTVAYAVIEAKANELIRSPNQSSWTHLDLLAAVQGLLIFQFIRLFDGDIRQRAQAEQAEPVLESWTEQLKSRTQTEQAITTSNTTSWRAWLFAESVRRTIIMSFMIRGIYSLSQLWDATSAFQWNKACRECSPLWVLRMNFDAVLREAKANEVDEFGIVMMVTYKGQDRVDEWLAAENEPRNSVINSDIFQNMVEATSMNASGLEEHFRLPSP
ncbi:hypothetical protein AOQ84DRAFT_170896 [Glonium stellatum]|uniref:Zn(2)-C6 fungal-type domain-containing protein n=1 Tax=Glonium stellatum TaxID=574774 RepID=A0A8E2F7G9_9PEZI|nr:hypothetical protein AOQ84DRAFT_170896 [Glonium stellatum]